MQLSRQMRYGSWMVEIHEHAASNPTIVAVDLSTCWWCGESVHLADTEPDAINRLLHVDEMGANVETGQRMHRVCLFRHVVGSVAHIEGRCSCVVPGSTEDDPEGCTKLEAAEASLAAFRRKRGIIGAQA